MDLQPGLGLEPFLRLDYGHSRNGNIQENGGDYALRASSQNNELFSSTLGLNLYGRPSDSTDLTAQIAWRNRLKNNDGRLDLAFDGGRDFAIIGAPLNRNAALLSLGLETKLSDTVKARLDYQGDFGPEATRGAGLATLTWAW